MPEIKKRFIGHLQSNKVKKCVKTFDTIDSVHSLKLLEKISRECQNSKTDMEIFLQINTSEEKQKKGFLADDLEQIFECFDVPSVKVLGLMTMAPFTQNEKTIRICFSRLRRLKEKINKYVKPKPLKHLSMGMSNDYEIAIEEGSTQIRLGTVLFGKRVESQKS